MAVLTTGAWSIAPAHAALPSCLPGAGLHLAGRSLTNAEVGDQSSRLRCADLTGANLSGLSLVQADLTGAVLRGADLAGADLTQATLTGADLARANLYGATLDQVTANGTSFRGADLRGASLVQADLTGASLNAAKLSGTDFSQATLAGATFKGASGLIPWSLYLLAGCGLALVLLALPVLYGGRRAAGRPAERTVTALLGCVAVAFGVHLFAGGLIDELIGGAGTPVGQACSGPQCPVGVASGVNGVVVGAAVVTIGLALMIRGTRGAGTAVGGRLPYQAW